MCWRALVCNPRNNEMRIALLQEASEQSWETLLDAALALGDDHYDPEAEHQFQFQSFSDDIFHFDVECIEDHGDYVRIAEKIQAMAKPDLDHLSFRDEIDIEAGIAKVFIQDKDGETELPLKVDDDWFDPQFMNIMANELIKVSSEKEIALLSESLGQDTLVICKTPDEQSLILKKTGLAFTGDHKQLGGQEGVLERIFIRFLNWFNRR